MSVGLEFLREAKVEVEDAAKYYERQVPGLGARFPMEIEKACALILRDPRLRRERSGAHRRINLPTFPYYLAYFIRGERILVAAVGHASRQPDYWKRRGFRDQPGA